MSSCEDRGEGGQRVRKWKCTTPKKKEKTAEGEKDIQLEERGRERKRRDEAAETSTTFFSFSSCF